MNAEYALILEDDEMNAELMKTVIDKMGYETQCDTSPVQAPLLQAITLAKNNEADPSSNDILFPSFIITDITMPIMNGMEFARIMKKAGYNTKHIAIISGQWSQPLQQEAEAMGCQTFHKPFRLLLRQNWIRSRQK